jgi:hypothetical protein
MTPSHWRFVVYTGVDLGEMQHDLLADNDGRGATEAMRAGVMAALINHRHALSSGSMTNLI